MKINVLLTSHNRKAKTISCLHTLFDARDTYNNNNGNTLFVSVFMTDDGCTDGTSSSVLSQFEKEEISIIQGDGNLYWARGMRLAWNAAMKHNPAVDYYLLINDDTDMLPNLFNELFATGQYSFEKHHECAIISGVTSAKGNHNEITYGGKVWDNKIFGTSHRVIPTDGIPVMCDAANANILLVPVKIVEKIGTFWEGFIHGCADYEYTSRAKSAGFPVLLTGNVCGRCDRDHDASEKEKMKMILLMSLNERKTYFAKPTKSSKDYLNYVKRTTPIRYPLVAIGRFMNIYLPYIYYGLGSWRD